MSLDDLAGGYGPSTAGNTGTTFGRKTGWGTSGQLQTGNPNKFVSLQADFSNAGDAGTYTIEFELAPNLNANNPIYAEALISWSVEGNTVTRRMNIGPGASISGVGQSVRVRMIDSTPNLHNPDAGVLYGVSCQISKGLRGSSEQGPLLVPRSPVAGVTGSLPTFSVIAPFMTVEVPQDAGVIAVKVLGLDLSDGTLAPSELTVIHQYTPGGGVSLVTAAYDAFNNDDWVPVTAGTNQIKLDNFAGLGPGLLQATVVFMIDG